MTPGLILASSSEIRGQLLRNAGLDFTVMPARVDETSIRKAMIDDQISPRDIADALAEMKARKVSGRNPGSLVIGCDQVLALGSEIFAKPETVEEAEAQLRQLRGKTHMLLSAAVIYESGEPVWRHIGVVRMTMRDFSDTYLQDYLARNWESVRTSVGAYKLEEEGVRLFSQVHGDYFCVLGLPLLEILAYLGLRGVLET